MISKNDVTARAGVDADRVDGLVALGIPTPDEDGSFTSGAARATPVVRDLEGAGLPLDGIAEAATPAFSTSACSTCAITTGSRPHP